MRVENWSSNLLVVRDYLDQDLPTKPCLGKLRSFVRLKGRKSSSNILNRASCLQHIWFLKKTFKLEQIDEKLDFIKKVEVNVARDNEFALKKELLSTVHKSNITG